MVESTGDLTDVPVPTGAAAANDVYSDNVTRKMNATEVKARLLTLLDEVATGGEIEIVEQGAAWLDSSRRRDRTG